jgi:hypothetical protein
MNHNRSFTSPGEIQARYFAYRLSISYMDPRTRYSKANIYKHYRRTNTGYVVLISIQPRYSIHQNF